MATRYKIVLQAAAIMVGGSLLLTSAPAQAGFFERLFDGLDRAFRSPERLPDAVREFAAPIEPRSERAIDPSGQVMGGPARAFCVRTCAGASSARPRRGSRAPLPPARWPASSGRLSRDRRAR